MLCRTQAHASTSSALISRDGREKCGWSQDAKCADGYIAVEKANECACEWPCDGLHCQGPFVAMPDYERKNPDELCVCQLPPKSKCHEEL
jgi:hypothetical protein